MDRRERFGDDTEALRTALDGRQAMMWTCLPGIIESFDPSTMTCSVQPSIQGRRRHEDGTYTLETMPICINVPVKFLGNSKFIIDFYLEKEDEGLIIFSSRCIDAWWQSGGIQPQVEYRMHDLSDGFFLPGIYSVPNVPSDETKDGVLRVRTTDGSVSISLSKSRIVLDAPSTETTGNFVAGNGVNGSFTTLTGQIVTVQNGIITSIFGG